MLELIPHGRVGDALPDVAHQEMCIRDSPNIENSIFRSIHAVALDTMPGYKSEGVEHSFLERFNAMEAASDENE